MVESSCFLYYITKWCWDWRHKFSLWVQCCTPITNHDFPSHVTWSKSHVRNGETSLNEISAPLTWWYNDASISAVLVHLWSLCCHGSRGCIGTEQVIAVQAAAWVTFRHSPGLLKSRPPCTLPPVHPSAGWLTEPFSCDCRMICLTLWTSQCRVAHLSGSHCEWVGQDWGAVWCHALTRKSWSVIDNVQVTVYWYQFYKSGYVYSTFFFPFVFYMTTLITLNQVFVVYVEMIFKNVHFCFQILAFSGS